MTKLNKQEVKAVANRIVRELTEKARLDRLRYISEYIPSPNYLKAETLVNEFLKLSKEECKIIDKKSKTYNELRNFLGSLGINGYFTVTEEILKKIIDIEYGVKEIPEVESLKEDIVIAGIDDTFDVEKFIKDKISEYSL